MDSCKDVQSLIDFGRLSFHRAIQIEMNREEFFYLLPYLFSLALSLGILFYSWRHRRVTETTLAVARAAGFNEEELLRIRRGSTLHDIGKMGIPDDILRKKGPLTEEEREVVKNHPNTAFELLKGIPYLEKSLEIPYCHHEKWDGSGYPRGLKGKEIPLSARIFAVVDVWDALSSDRPYREAWSREKVAAYLLNESGKHFDPKVLDIFLELMRQGKI